METAGGSKYGREEERKRRGEEVNREKHILEGPGSLESICMSNQPPISHPTHTHAHTLLSLSVSRVYSLIFSTRQPLTLDGWG